MANFRRNRPRKQPNKCLCCSWWRWQGNKAARKDLQRHKADLSASEQIADSDTFEAWMDRMRERHGPYFVDDDEYYEGHEDVSDEWADWEEWKEKSGAA